MTHIEHKTEEVRENDDSPLLPALLDKEIGT